jgi:pimeloyl-ACP methyl ester carboxylesterase
VTVGCTTLRVDAGPAAPAGVTMVEVDVFHPETAILGRRPPVLVCLPGGGMSRRYFDLDVPPQIGPYSMARYLAGRGMVVVTIDHPGVGGSDRPEDGYSLTSETVAGVDGHVTDRLLAALRAGSLVPDLPPLPDLQAVGVGHSMGAYVTVVQQARYRSHERLVLLGFAGCGLPSFLTDEELRYAGDPDGLRLAVADLVKARFRNPLPGGSTSTSSLLIRGEQPPEARTALGAASAPLLALVGLTTMVPGASADVLAAIDVPVFLGVGGLDITGDPRAIPAGLPACDDVTLFVLAGSGHNHNVDVDRTRLWDRIAGWVQCRP